MGLNMTYWYDSHADLGGLTTEVQIIMHGGMTGPKAGN